MSDDFHLDLLLKTAPGNSERNDPTDEQQVTVGCESHHELLSGSDKLHGLEIGQGEGRRREERGRGRERESRL